MDTRLGTLKIRGMSVNCGVSPRRGERTAGTDFLTQRRQRRPQRAPRRFPSIPADSLDIPLSYLRGNWASRCYTVSGMSSQQEALDLYCPHCGYNLCGIDSGRCPECGEPFDRATASISRIPWMHRPEIGRIKGWWRTVWMVTWKARVV